MASLDPRVIAPANPEAVEIGFRTLISEFATGAEQRRRTRLFPRRNVPLKYNHIDPSDARTLWQFFIDRAGSWQAWNYFVYQSNSYEQEYVGTGNGTQTAWNCPSRDALSVSVYIDTAIQTEGTNYEFTARGGADGADLLTFTTPPPVGSFVTMSFTGTLKIRGVFADDRMSYETFYSRLVTIGVAIRGLYNA